MIYNEAVDYIHSLLRFGIRPGLTGMGALLHYLDNPQKDLKCVHVAGTNGKGSSSTAISNILIDAGYKVGLYTSPFVSDFLERVQFCGEPVCKKVFADNVSKVKSAVEKLEKQDIIITEFEALTAAAFLCFKELKCDVAVLEVGLGGRLDATNIISTPLVNIITSLSLDHVSVLGDTIEKIAYEKCGTIKDNGTVISSYGQPSKALKVIEETASQHNCSLIIPNEKSVVINKSDIYGTDFTYKNNDYTITMPGIHQVKNMTSVIEGVNVLKKYFKISQDNIFNGIKNTVLPARVEILNNKPLVILDGGHNEDGAIAFFNSVKDVLNSKKRVFVLGGMMADKAVENSLKPLMESTDVFVSVTPQNPRSMKAADLSQIASKYCKEYYTIDCPQKAVDYILDNLEKDDAFFAVGSLYLAGEIRNYLIEKLKKFN